MSPAQEHAPGGSARWSGSAAAGAVLSALVASACCIGPLVLALLGLGGAGLLLKLEPYRPYFIAATAALLGSGFYLAYRRPRAAAATDTSGTAGDACDCERPRASRAGRALLWIATVVVVLFLVFPYLSGAVAG